MTTHLKTDLKTVPSNRGYILEEKKAYGYAPKTKDADVRLIEPSKKSLHIWNKKAHIHLQMNKKETDREGWTEVKRRRLISTNSMTHCPHELSQNGHCQLRWMDAEHRAKHYHFTTLDQGRVVYGSNGNPLCRYHLNDCWEKFDKTHMKNFSHE